MLNFSWALHEIEFSGIASLIEVFTGLSFGAYLLARKGQVIRLFERPLQEIENLMIESKTNTESKFIEGDPAPALDSFGNTITMEDNLEILEKRKERILQDYRFNSFDVGVYCLMLLIMISLEGLCKIPHEQWFFNNVVVNTNILMAIIIYHRTVVPDKEKETHFKMGKEVVKVMSAFILGVASVIIMSYFIIAPLKGVFAILSTFVIIVTPLILSIARYYMLYFKSIRDMLFPKHVMKLIFFGRT